MWGNGGAGLAWPPAPPPPPGVTGPENQGHISKSSLRQTMFFSWKVWHPWQYVMCTFTKLHLCTLSLIIQPFKRIKHSSNLCFLYHRCVHDPVKHLWRSFIYCIFLKTGTHPKIKLIMIFFFFKVVIKIGIQSFEKIPRRTGKLARVQVQLKLTINT